MTDTTKCVVEFGEYEELYITPACEYPSPHFDNKGRPEVGYESENTIELDLPNHLLRAFFSANKLLHQAERPLRELIGPVYTENRQARRRWQHENELRDQIAEANPGISWSDQKNLINIEMSKYDEDQRQREQERERLEEARKHQFPWGY